MPEQAFTVERSLPPYKSRLDQWVEEVNDYQARGQKRKENRRTDELLGQGYELFFATLEPLKKKKWLRAEHPDIKHHIFVLTEDPRLRDFDPELFAGLSVRYRESWEVNVYDYFNFLSWKKGQQY